MLKPIRIALVDSGINENIRCNNPVVGYAISFDENENRYDVVQGRCYDDIGHGSAIINIIDKNVESVEIDVFKLFQKSFEVEEEILLQLLMYISNNNKYDILHISSGILQPDQYWKLYNVCKKISDNGTVIISAFDNNGCVSYPAAFPFVIGVDLSENKLKLTEYEFVCNSIINIRASSSFHRLKWVEPPLMLAQGTSFSSVYITLKVIEYLREGSDGLENVLLRLKEDAVKVYDADTYKSYNCELVEDIKNAIIFPFNKEMHSLIRYEDNLKFRIYGIYDSKYSLKVGKKIREIENSIESDEIIQDVEKIDWNGDFDTVILGHTDRLNKQVGIDYMSKLIEKSIRSGKKVYSFDKVSMGNNNQIYYPRVSLNMVPVNRFGKLRCISKPVLGIWGTSSKQGKYTLQMKIKKELQERGYKVGWLATEPQSLLMGADRVFPIGYNSTVAISNYLSVLLLNEYMWEIDTTECDIILVGSQSGTVPCEIQNLSFYPEYQYDLLVGTQPDYIILSVNPHDEYDYIQRTIAFIEGSTTAKVIGLVLFPMITDVGAIGMKINKRRLLANELKEKMRELEEIIGLRTYLLDSDRLVEDIIEVFTNESE